MPMGIGLGIGVTRGGGVGGGAPAFSPASLFAASEPGVWYDPSDFSTMFQTGSIPVTAVEQPVGLMLDKSQGLALGTQYAPGGFTDPTATWDVFSATTNGFSATKSTAGGTDGAYTVASVVAVVGRWYKIEIDVSSITLADFSIGLSSTINARSTFPIITAAGAATYVSYVQANVSSGTFSIRVATTSLGSITVTAVRAAEVLGNHATQATSASRPVLSARVNLLLATATLSTQSVTTLAATYTLSFTGAGTVTTTGTNIGVYSAGTHSITCTAGTLTLTVVGAVTLADLRVANTGVGLPAYQAVVTSTDYDTTGFPLYLRFDGTDDSMATGTITPGVDKVQVFSGVRKQSDAAQAVVAELSATIATNNGTFLLAAPDAATATFAFDSKGTAQVDAVASAFTAPLTGVVSGLGDIAGDTARIRVNGVQVDQDTGDQGTGNFLAYPLYIGRRGGTTLPFNGNLYSLIVRFGANLDATTISNTETWVNGKTMAY